MGESYYAGDRKIELDRAEDYVAVDQKAAKSAGLEKQVATAGGDAPRQGGGVVLMQRSALSEKTLTALHDAGALQPVYRRDPAVMVALPEVRVEFDTPEQRRAVTADLADDSELPPSVSESTDIGLTVRPTSGDGADALKIANKIHESGHAAAASVRFIQFVPKPMVRS
jgi:hypothetical protein